MRYHQIIPILGITEGRQVHRFDKKAFSGLRTVALRYTVLRSETANPVQTQKTTLDIVKSSINVAVNAY